jgi:siroheme synthase-like protein
VGHYPLFVDLHGRPCLVIGGGAIAEGKVRGLLDAGAAVTVISPTLTPHLTADVAAHTIRHHARAYRDGDLAGFVLAFAATGDLGVNGAVAAEGRGRGVWVNAVDDPAHCDFIVPSILRRDALTVAVSTGGASPALARVVREELETYLGNDYAALTEIAGSVRRELFAERRRVDGRAWGAALRDRGFRRLVVEGRPALARRRLRARLEAACAT